ncbi:MAG: hypothetical protein IPP19_17000 [Verrucomicrobia bacterium]|nr:hypothetical protein [Verrucomicrobiota bacterium]
MHPSSALNASGQSTRLIVSAGFHHSATRHGGAQQPGRAKCCPPDAQNKDSPQAHTGRP